jgi:hypothetical protein
MNMKKIIILLILGFGIFSNSYSIDKYSIDSVKIRVNNVKYENCYTLYEWQSWQKVNGQLYIDKDNKRITLALNMSKIYIYMNEKLERYSNNINLDCFYTNDVYTLSIYVYNNDTYFYILDDYNQIEVIYKLNKKWKN